MNRLMLACLLLALSAAACALQPSQVLVCYNPASTQSVALKDHYVSAHAGVKTLAVPWSYPAAADGFTCTSGQASALDKAIRAGLVAQKCDVAVLCRDLPGLIYGGSGSLDSLVMSDGKGARANPFYSQTNMTTPAPFTHARFGCYLVTRIDGWTWEDANALIERSLGAVKGGAILLDQDPMRTGGFARWNNELTSAAARVIALGWPVTLDTSATFVGGLDVAAYFSWGSNDAHFNSTTWKALRFRPGAIAATAVSTSAASLRTPPTGGQSQIGQLIHNGVTGVVGDVCEPFLVAIADPSVAAPAYLRGYSLGEALFSALPQVGWKEVICGDPLCAPYAAK